MATHERQAPRTDQPMLALGALATALVVLALVVRLGGAFSAAATPGLSQTGELTKIGLSVARLGTNVAAVLTVGWLLAAAVLVPGPSGVTRRCLRAASFGATAWALSALALAAFSVSDLFGVPATGITGNMLRTFLIELPQGRALVLVIAVAAVLAAAARSPRAEGGAGYLLLGALAGLLPPLFTGHAASAAHHALAVYSLAAHVAGAALWIGGLVAVVTVAPDVPDRLPQVVGRYSGLALVSFAVVGASGAVNAWVRLGGVHLGSRYGALVVAKAAALALLGAMGWWHRRATIPALRAGTGARGFVRLGAAEIVAMAATMALATGLSRTPPPEVSPGTLDPVALRLGFPLPGPAGVGPYLLDWRIDPLFIVLTAAGAALYGVGVLRARPDGWPLHRTLAWTAGLAVLLLTTCGGLARYSMVLFSAHAVQHVMVGMIAPLLLLHGAPLELARRALPATGMLDAAAGSRGARALAHPLVATPLLLLTLYAWYASSLFGSSLGNHALHSLAMAGFLMIGLAFFATTAGTWLPLAVLPLNVLGGLVLLRDGTVLGGGWYEGLGRTWGAAPLADQHLGAGLLCTIATAVTLLSAVPARWRSRDRVRG